ncbi:MAG: methyltransferase domain-containing protein [Anaerolineaceae bacterium]|nr:methyltransferase domain-containing protein [Anaerolineaceae bacterium]
MDKNTVDFYDTIAEHYPLLFRDWERQLEREGLGLRAMFRGKGVVRILDVGCGPGTQAIPLAELDYHVVATDPSPGMLKMAHELAREHGVEDRITIERADIDNLLEIVEGPFDGLVCKGNVLPHMLSDTEIEHALLTFWELLRPGGSIVIGLRDFESYLEYRPTFLPGLNHIEDNGYEFIAYEIWEWEEGPPVIATQNLYITEGMPNRLVTTKRTVSFRPLSTDEIKVVLSEIGYEDIDQQIDRTELVITARKSLSGIRKSR